jgi:cell division protein FtsQ
MWDRPEIMNSVSSALIAAAILLALYGGIFLLANLPLFPVRQVSVSNAAEPGAELHHVTREQVQAVIGERLKGTFFTVDLEAARAAFSGLPWVRNVEVRRTWPDKLEVAIEEQVAFANWSDGKLVNTHGELFDAALVDGLPVFSGPPGSEGEVTRRYREFSEDFKKLGFNARQVALSPRLAWDIKLDNGLALKLGRDQPRDPLRARLDRFVAAYADSVGRISGRLDLADLRYTQGFALHLSPGASFQAAGSKPAAANDKHAPPAKGKA